MSIVVGLVLGVFLLREIFIRILAGPRR